MSSNGIVALVAIAIGAICVAGIAVRVEDIMVVLDLDGSVRTGHWIALMAYAVGAIASVVLAWRATSSLLDDEEED